MHFAWSFSMPKSAKLREHAEERAERAEHAAPEPRDEAVHEEDRDEQNDDEPRLVEVELVRLPHRRGERVLRVVGGGLDGRAGTSCAAPSAAMRRRTARRGSRRGRWRGPRRRSDRRDRRSRCPRPPRGGTRTSGSTSRAGSACVLFASTRDAPLPLRDGRIQPKKWWSVPNGQIHPQNTRPKTSVTPSEPDATRGARDRPCASRARHRADERIGEEERLDRIAAGAPACRRSRRSSAEAVWKRKYMKSAKKPICDAATHPHQDRG